MTVEYIEVKCGLWQVRVREKAEATGKANLPEETAAGNYS